jgi:hypothetical protein
METNTAARQMLFARTFSEMLNFQAEGSLHIIK